MTQKTLLLTVSVFALSLQIFSPASLLASRPTQDEPIQEGRQSPRRASDPTQPQPAAAASRAPALTGAMSAAKREGQVLVAETLATTQSQQRKSFSFPTYYAPPPRPADALFLDGLLKGGAFLKAEILRRETQRLKREGD